MDSTQFAERWLRTNGLFDADSDYHGMLGEATLDVWKFIAAQQHSGASAGCLFALLAAIKRAYDDGDSPIWQEYWQTDEGKALKASFLGQTGQSLVEYGVIILLIALVVVGGLAMIGPAVAHGLSGVLRGL